MPERRNGRPTSSSGTVVAEFRDRASLNRAVRELAGHSIPVDSIHVYVRSSDGRRREVPVEEGAGTLQIGDGGATGSIRTGAITNNGTLAINRSNALTMANVIGGTGTLRHDGTGTTTLSGTSTFTGAVELNGGIVQIG